MRLRIHHALFAGFLGVIGLLAGLIVLVVGIGLDRELRSNLREGLTRELALGEAVLSASNGRDPQALARLLTDRTGYRVTLISLDGVVLADSYLEPGDLPQVENHAGRPEVARVIDGQETTSFAERTSATVGIPLLYAARMAALDDEPIVLRMAAEQADIEAASGRIQRTVALIGLFTVLLALIAAYALSRMLARPLVVLADRLRRRVEGDLTSTVPHSHFAELHDVAVVFQRLMEQLDARLAELGRERDGMQALIDCMAEGVIALTEDGRLLRTNRTARALLGFPEDSTFSPIGSVIRHPELRDALKDSIKRPEQSREIEIGGRHILLASRALDLGGAVTTLLDISELRRMERVRSDFVANASHELKTPLTSIRGYAEALTDEPPEEVRRQFLSSILNNTLRMQRLVDDLLDLSRLESGGWSASVESVWVGEAIQEAWELVAPRADHTVELTVKGRSAVLGDRQGLVQVFRNLLENAVRHTEADGQVRVAIAPAAGVDTVHISVSDDGEGIPAQALPRIFERFYRADSSRARDVGGTGLGLAIVKHLVGAMDGHVWAESELGHGTTVHITLPKA